MLSWSIDPLLSTWGETRLKATDAVRSEFLILAPRPNARLPHTAARRQRSIRAIGEEALGNASSRARKAFYPALAHLGRNAPSRALKSRTPEP
jgi:hypothetical protein